MTQHQTSAGHNLSAGAWLDVHFEACRPEYEAMLTYAGIEPGGRVLDAGCGAGSYLKLLHETLGTDARVYGIDLAPENATATGLRVEGAGVAVASVLKLPFADAAFDAVWCANVCQFLTDEELAGLLAEFQRVLRPRGLLALKDVDMTAWRIEPAPPLLGLHLAEACILGEDVKPWSRGSLRGRSLGGWLAGAGFEDVAQRSFPIERWAPLAAAETQLWSDWLPYLAALAEERGVPTEDLETWRRVATPQEARAFGQRPDFYCCELQVVVTGRSPA